MLPKNLENIEGRQLTDQELDVLYLYLDMYMDGMSEEEKSAWINILRQVDKEFYEYTSNGADELQDVQSSTGSS